MLSPNACDDRFFGGSTDQLFQIGSDRYSGHHFQLDSILGDGGQGIASAVAGVRAIDHFRMDTGPNRLQNIATGQINGRRLVEVEVDPRAMGSDQALMTFKTFPPAR